MSKVIRNDGSSITISVSESCNIALCQLDRVPMNVEQFGLKDGVWFYFNRLKVPHKMRRRGIATDMMNELVTILDSCSFNVLLEINPYGDGGPDLADLTKFYAKFGFIEIEPALMYRYGSKNG